MMRCESSGALARCAKVIPRFHTADGLGPKRHVPNASNTKIPDRFCKGHLQLAPWQYWAFFKQHMDRNFWVKEERAFGPFSAICVMSMPTRTSAGTACSKAHLSYVELRCAMHLSA